jgi:hypothetical protein
VSGSENSQYSGQLLNVQDSSRKPDWNRILAVGSRCPGRNDRTKRNQMPDPNTTR